MFYLILKNCTCSLFIGIPDFVLINLHLPLQKNKMLFQKNAYAILYMQKQQKVISAIHLI